MDNKQHQDRRAVIVCSHVAKQNLPILRAVCDPPEMDEDSGWQFVCGVAEEENPDEAQVWLMFEVVEHDTSLNSIIKYPPGTLATRIDIDHPWEIHKK